MITCTIIMQSRMMRERDLRAWMAFLDRLLLSIFRTFLKRRARAKSAVLVCTDKHRKPSAGGQGMFAYPAAEGQKIDSQQCCQNCTAATGCHSMAVLLCAPPLGCACSGQGAQRPMHQQTGRGVAPSNMSAARPASQAGAMSRASSLPPETQGMGLRCTLSHTAAFRSM